MPSGTTVVLYNKLHRFPHLLPYTACVTCYDGHIADRSWVLVNGTRFESPTNWWPIWFWSKKRHHKGISPDSSRVTPDDEINMRIEGKLGSGVTGFGSLFLRFISSSFSLYPPTPSLQSRELHSCPDERSDYEIWGSKTREKYSPCESRHVSKQYPSQSIIYAAIRQGRWVRVTRA